MTTAEIKDMASKYIINTYGERPISIVRGEGAYVWDAEGKRYLDFVAGIATNNVGHCHPRVVEAIVDQARKLIHVSNLYYIEPQARLAKRLVELSFADKCFFCNSGAEANEAAIKLARKYSKENVGENKYEIITMLKSFHGRTAIQFDKIFLKRQFALCRLYYGFNRVIGHGYDRMFYS